MIYRDYLVVNDLDEVSLVLLDLLEHGDEVVFFVVDERLFCHCAPTVAPLIIVGQLRARAVPLMDVQGDQAFFQ